MKYPADTIKHKTTKLFLSMIFRNIFFSEDRRKSVNGRSNGLNKFPHWHVWFDIKYNHTQRHMKHG